MSVITHNWNKTFILFFYILNERSSFICFTSFVLFMWNCFYCISHQFCFLIHLCLDILDIPSIFCDVPSMRPLAFWRGISDAFVSLKAFSSLPSDILIYKEFLWWSYQLCNYHFNIVSNASDNIALLLSELKTNLWDAAEWFFLCFCQASELASKASDCALKSF